MTVAILALQGAFIEHRQALEKLGAESFEIREAADLEKPFDRLILPGGESTVQRKLLLEDGIFEGLKQRIEDGMPVLGTCAGLILLAQEVEGGQPCFGTLPVTVRRNAYGRQLGSFHAEAEFDGLGPVPMTFIRAPFITAVHDGAKALATVDGNVVAARAGNQIGVAFHPELDDDLRIHRMFLDL
ncbi:MAG: pyridoxal 5'-phosphate synthase glutaminase subunit PdxT [Eggerthellaceae bacterium]|jgi:5'-phosphate synthase pdxT subunit